MWFDLFGLVLIVFSPNEMLFLYWHLKNLYFQNNGGETMISIFFIPYFLLCTCNSHCNINLDSHINFYLMERNPILLVSIFFCQVFKPGVELEYNQPKAQYSFSTFRRMKKNYMVASLVTNLLCANSTHLQYYTFAKPSLCNLTTLGCHNFWPNHTI